MSRTVPSGPPDGGAATYDDGKPPLELLPPDVLLEIAKVHAHGKHKYGHETRSGLEARFRSTEDEEAVVDRLARVLSRAMRRSRLEHQGRLLLPRYTR